MPSPMPAGWYRAIWEPDVVRPRLRGPKLEFGQVAVIQRCGDVATDGAHRLRLMSSGLLGRLWLWLWHRLWVVVDRLLLFSWVCVGSGRAEASCGEPCLGRPPWPWASTAVSSSPTGVHCRLAGIMLMTPVVPRCRKVSSACQKRTC